MSNFVRYTINQSVNYTLLNMIKKYLPIVFILFVFTSLHLSAQTIKTIAGIGGSQGFSGDNGAAISAKLANPTCIVVAQNKDIYIADKSNQRIRKVDGATGVITTIAGNTPTSGFPLGSGGYNGDNCLGINAELNNPFGIALYEPTHTLYIADYNNSRVRKLDLLTDSITTYAGNGTMLYNGDNIPKEQAQMSPYALAVDASGNLFVADIDNNRVRKINAATGTVTTYAGNGVIGGGGDNNLAVSANLNGPSGLAFDAAGNLFIADRGNQKIRRVDATSGIIIRVAGNGTVGSGGDNGQATNAQLYNPNGLVVDGFGNIYFADKDNHKIRKVVAANSTIVTVAGNGSNGFSGDNGPALNAGLGQVTGVALDVDGSLYMVDNVSTARKICSVSMPGVSITVNPSGPINPGTSVTFTATPANGGTSPVFQWTKNGAIVGTNSNTYTDNTFSNGDTVNCRLCTYNICLGNDTTASNTIQVVVNNPNKVASATTLSPVGLSAYPNPAVNNVSIEHLSGKSNYKILNVIGNTVGQGIITPTDNQVSLSQLNSGIYLIELTDYKGQRNVLRIVKQ
jgi:trimeric autotransporter adhesin